MENEFARSFSEQNLRDIEESYDRKLSLQKQTLVDLDLPPFSLYKNKPEENYK